MPAFLGLSKFHSAVFAVIATFQLRHAADLPFDSVLSAASRSGSQPGSHSSSLPPPSCWWKGGTYCISMGVSPTGRTRVGYCVEDAKRGLLILVRWGAWVWKDFSVRRCSIGMLCCLECVKRILLWRLWRGVQVSCSHRYVRCLELLAASVWRFLDG